MRSPCSDRLTQHLSSRKNQQLEISFKNEILDEVSDRYLILGDNGTGKTTLLQAIALPLALATNRIRDISDFDWIGFLPSRYWRWGSPRIELQVLFEEEELNTTRELARKWYDAQPPEFKQRREFDAPGDSKRVHLVLSGDYWQAGDTPAEQAQFRGRYYAQWFIRRGDQSVRKYFVSQLMKIEPTCQFMITTHSDSVSNVIGESETYRLPGGSLCLY